MAENEDVICFEEGMSWLPAHVVDEACHHHHHHQQQQKAQFGYPRSRQHRPIPSLNYSRCSSLRSQRTRHPPNRTAAAGGPGMQAIFLDSGRSCSGTGVFLPRRTGTNFQYASNKHVRPPPPVLLPDRVVQALNLNVHNLNMQIKPCRESVKNMKGNKDCNRKKASDCHSPEIFLPKEWTY